MVTAAVGFIVGLVLGSFIKAAADRVIKGESLWGRSYCASCKSCLRWYDLFPFFSYLLLQGKCRYCQKNIPVGSFLTEVIFGVVTASLFVLTLPGNIESQNAFLLGNLFFRIFFLAVLAMIFLIDLESGLIPDLITYPAMAVAVSYLIISFALESWLLYQSLATDSFGRLLLPPASSYLWDHLGRIWEGGIWAMGAAIASSSFFTLLIIITRGKGMGWGDVKYVFFLGLVLSFPNILLAILFAFVIGAIFSLIMIASGKKHLGQTIPFGPFLSLGAGITLLQGQQIINWYLHSFS